MKKNIIFILAFIINAVCFAQSDLATFNLKNGVTKCYGEVYEDPNPGTNVQLTFDAKGKLLTIGGQKTTDTYNYEIKRDNNGRIVSIGYLEGDAFNIAVFSYDSNGRVFSINTTWQNLDTDAEGFLSEASLMWNDKGELYQIDIWDEDGNCINHMYEYTEYDEKGNWIKRIHKDSNGNEWEEKRDLSYDAQ